MNTPPEAGPEQPDGDEQPASATPTAPVVPATRVTSTPLLPSQSREDTDVGWGDYGDRDRDDDRLLRDRPPHYGNG